MSGSLYRFSGVTAIANGLRFTLGTINVASTPLPIELLSFTATPRDRTTVDLEWVTASEQGNDHFTVERSTDLEVWEPVAVVEAVGNSTATNSYGAMDADLHGKLLYYRLRQTDVDGTSTLSDVVPVELISNEGARPVIYPNPSDGPIVIVLPNGVSDAVAFTLIDPAGRSIPLSAQAVAPGSYRADPGEIPPGTYVLHVRRGEAEEAYSIRILR